MTRSLSVIFILLVFCTSISAEDSDFIKKKTLELQRREAELRTEEKRLETLKKDIDARISENNQIMANIQKSLDKIKTINSEQFAKVVEVYENMKPAEAAKGFSKMEAETIAAIFAVMKPQKAAKIMALIEPEKVAEITKKMTNAMQGIPAK